jgi:hypothetical protein
MIVEQHKAEIVESPSYSNGFKTFVRTDEGDVYDLTGHCVGYPKGVKGTLYMDLRDTFYISYIFIPNQKEVPK